MKWTALMFVFLLAAGCTNAPDPVAERERLLMTDREFAETSIREGAAEAFNRYLAEHAIQLPQGRPPVLGREAIYRQMVDGSDHYELAWDPQFAEVSASADMGWTWGTYVFTDLSSGDPPARTYGKYLNVWTKNADGAWRVAVDMGNDNPEPN